MNMPPFIAAVLKRLRRRPVVFGAGAVIVAVVVVLLVNSTSAPSMASSSFEVRRGDFLISIVEGGTIEAVNEEVIRSDVEGTARIIFIVPEGSTVKKGDLLVELDSSSSQDAVNQQQINVEKAQLAVIQAEQTLEIQKSTVASEVAAAELKVEFAQSDYNKYVKGEALQLRRNAQIEITNVLETLSINLERLEWTEQLYKQRFETKANLDKDRLAVSQSKLKLEQAEKALWMLEMFDEPKKKRELEALLKEATDNLERVKLQGESKLAQYRADVQTQKKTLDLNLAKLERDKKQLQATKIYAPQDGLVVYGGGGGGGGDRRFSSESMIEEGAVIRNRQEIIKLPDVSHMKLTVRIHESHINQIRSGQSAFVVLDSMPDRRFRGVVGKVAPLPDSSSRWGNPNLKVYPTEIRITDDMPDVKPGVSARAEIVITNLASVLTVPIQSVTTRKGQQVVFLAGDSPRPVPVQVGMYNNKFIEIASGLEEGERVLLAPPFDTEGKDLGGALIAKGDALPQVDSNAVRRALAPDNGTGERPRGDGEGRTRGEGAGRGLGPAPGPRFDSPAEGAAGGERRSRFGGPGGGGGGEPGGGNFLSREEMLKQFDKNGDGQLDEDEKAAMRARFGSRRRGTNAPPQDSGPR